jgi:hypothetical protein
MSLKPIDNTSWSIWYTEAHLNQFNTELSGTYNPSTGVYEPPTTNLSNNPTTANISYGGLSATYAVKGTKVAGEFDYFRGEILNDPAMDVHQKINSYDLYLTGSQMLNTATPISVGIKFGIGGPISYQHYDMTYYSQIQNTRTIFGDVLGNNWQPIEINAPITNYFYNSAGEAMGTNLANRYGIMVDATEFLGSGNNIQESLIHEAWLKDTINGSPVAGGHDIGTEFDLNFTHHFTKTLAWQAWGAYVWTGSGVDASTGLGNGFEHADHKDITALGSAVIWNF